MRDNSTEFDDLGAREAAIQSQPAADQPGTFLQQILAITAFWQHPDRDFDLEGAWQESRQYAIPHARLRDGGRA